jgi:hypothetical protein
MKSFNEYLTESKKVYEFKVKLAGDHQKAGEVIKSALAQYKVESCSAGKRLPIAETHADFPHITNTNVTIFDVCTSYPVTSQQVRALIAEKCRCPLSSVKVRNLAEDAEEMLNHANDEKSGEALLNKDYEADSSAQKLVGEKQKFNLLKELMKDKKTLEQYKGVNDAILASSTPTESAPTDSSKINTKSPVGSVKVKKPTAKTVGVK